ncbi:MULTISPECIES: hypothetical protein, partial [unclassified Microcoleus]|uniref:hypothetical protein n=1 Tax=unclassified Microcoleus TaxID=2642155 RepID=UPI002FCEDBCB
FMGKVGLLGFVSSCPRSCLDAVEDGANASHSGEQKTRNFTQIWVESPRRSTTAFSGAVLK